MQWSIELVTIEEDVEVVVGARMGPGTRTGVIDTGVDSGWWWFCVRGVWIREDGWLELINSGSSIRSGSYGTDFVGIKVELGSVEVVWLAVEAGMAAQVAWLLIGAGPRSEVLGRLRCFANEDMGADTGRPENVATRFVLNWTGATSWIPAGLW